jgi:hypothetical protein
MSVKALGAPKMEASIEHEGTMFNNKARLQVNCPSTPLKELNVISAKLLFLLNITLALEWKLLKLPLCVIDRSIVWYNFWNDVCKSIRCSKNGGFHRTRRNHVQQ